MKKCIFISLIFILLVTFAKGQQEFYIVKGYIKDSLSKSPLSSASISYEGNSEVSISDKSGYFKITVTSFPCSLIVSHLGYNNKTINIPSFNTKVEVLLSEKTNELPELSVTVIKPVPITKEEPLYIADYRILNDKILALAYKNKVLSRARLYLLTFEGDTIFSVPVSKPDQLYKDCYGNNYFLSKNNAFQLTIDSCIIDFLFPFPADEFIQLFNILAEARGEEMFLKKYTLNNQVLEYITYDKSAKTYSELFTIENEKNARMLHDRSRIIYSSDNPELQTRFEDMAFYKPVFAPLLNIHDTLFLFNFEDSWIGCFNDSGNIVKQTSIAFHQNKDWKREIYFDEATGKVYTLFRKNGLSTLKEINLETGQLTNQVQIPDLPFVDNIQIHNGMLYFLYTDHSTNEEMRMLYCMKM